MVTFKQVLTGDRPAKEKVVIATGNKPENRLYDQIRELGFETHRIGDCVEPRSAKTAIYEGTLLGRSI